MNHLALDLELEQPNRHDVVDSQVEHEKIIQVGWVVFSDTFEILKEQQMNINIGVPLSTFIKTLTGITDEDIANGCSLAQVYKELTNDREMFDTSRVVIQWGSGDMQALKKELNPSDWQFGKSGLNVKHLYQVYAEANGFNRSGGLSKVVARLGLHWLGRGKHQAGVDALNTAQVYNFLYNKLKE